MKSEVLYDFLNAFNLHNRLIILKARQIGFSTLICGLLYHRTIMTPGTNTAIIGYNAPLTMELLEKVKMFLSTTPDKLRPTVQYNSKYEISFPNIYILHCLL